FLPSSIGLTVLLPMNVDKIEARVGWGDYVTEPPLPEAVLRAEDNDGARRPVDWVRVPQQRTVALPIAPGRGRCLVPDSSPAQLTGGGALELTTHAREFAFDLPDGTRECVRAVTVFLVNRRTPPRRRYADVAYAFQARLELACEQGFRPRYDLSGYESGDEDLQIADLHYRDVEEYAVGRNAAAAWQADDDGFVRHAWTDHLPLAEVERVAPNENIADVEFGMEALSERAAQSGEALASALAQLPALYSAWITAQQRRVDTFPGRRRGTARRLVEGMQAAEARIRAGIGILETDDRARLAFRIMNQAVARAARRRDAIARVSTNPGVAFDPAAERAPRWRPFQLAFILLNLAGLVDKTHPDRETVDLLFFPTGGGKTEAYLGLAAFAIAHRRLTNSGVLGAGVTVIMRYTLRLLTLDQLARAAGVICALELMRGEPAYIDNGHRLLGDWPIEIGLWVGSDASPNRLGGRGDTGDHTAVTRVRRFVARGGRAPAPIKSCPWCGTSFGRQSFQCAPNLVAPRNLEIRCANPDCDFTGNRALPVLTVDEPIYRRLPAFLVATVDKFAGLPWVGECGAFFGHVDQFEEGIGFYGAAARGGRRLFNDASLDPPDLIVQDELHLISGPLGTVAGLYETAIDRLATREYEGHRIRPKIVASTATVRRASDQIRALFDRDATAVFPPPGLDRTDSFFAQTLSSAASPARWYLGLAAQGRGPKLVFLRALTTLVAAAQAEYETAAARLVPGERNPADPFMTAVCYFNALRELGGARRIVEDEVRDRAGRYGTERRRVSPPDVPFRDRRIGVPMELTSRVSTDQVAEAKQRLETAFGGNGETVDVALATNMISVGLDILRLGLMLVQGQPKTAAEYIQATSRVGRDSERPGLVVTVLNLHKPRDRTHYEQFGQFHRTFYRAVEATSVTPWAARALDRALAAVVVALARHIDPGLTPEMAVTQLENRADIRAQVCDAILDRAPASLIVGGRPGLQRVVEGLMTDWIATVAEMTANGSPFLYGSTARRLLHVPLDPASPNLSVAHRRFVAGRSMRDVEPNTVLKPRDPYNNPIAGDEDVA
ncbi:MAG: DISARM system helicase DrmA, partial [Stellaceae bacterium]